MSKDKYMMLKFIDYNLSIFLGKGIVCDLPTFSDPDHSFYEQDILSMMMILKFSMYRRIKKTTRIGWQIEVYDKNKKR